MNICLTTATTMPTSEKCYDVFSSTLSHRLSAVCWQSKRTLWFDLAAHSLSISLLLSAECGMCVVLLRTYIDNPTVASAILYTTDSVCVFKSYQIFNCKCCMCDQDRHKRRDTTNARTRTFLFYFLLFLYHFVE